MKAMERTIDEALMEHLTTHVSFPATKAQLLEACKTGEFPEQARQMAGDAAQRHNLPLGRRGRG
jgi:hypothetical protein